MKSLSEAKLKEILDTDPYRESREEYVDRMKCDGFEIYYPESNELLIDLDSEEAKDFFEERLNRVIYELDINHEPELYEDITCNIIPSKTKGHYHAIVEMPFELDSMERIALQAVLGSDLVREMLSIFRIWLGDKQPTLLAMLKTKTEQISKSGKNGP